MAAGRGPTWYATLDTKGVERGSREVEGQMRRLHTTSTATGTAIGNITSQAIDRGWQALAGSVRTGWEEMKEAQVASAKLDSVLRSTHQAAGLNRAAMDAMNEALQKESTLEGDVITNAQALMATFTKVGRETFPGAMRAAMDMSRVFDMDVNRATVTLGKALQDPVKGMSALTRVGVTFTQQQKEQVKALVEAGKTQQAQGLILKEVNKHVGGAEQAYARTLPGALDKAKRAYKDFTEGAVTAAVREWPKAQKAIGQVSDWLKRNVVPAVRAAVEDIKGFWRDHEQDIRRVVGLIKRTLERIGAIVAGVARLVRAVIKGDWGEAWDAAKDIVSNVFDGIKDILKTMVPILGRAALAIGKRIVSDLWNGLKNLASGIVSRLGGAISTAGAWVMGKAKSIGSSIIQGIVDGVKAGAGRIKDAIASVIPDDITPGFDMPGFAGGGLIPGTYRGVDDRLMMVASGEAILTPQQQAMVPGGRSTLHRIFQRTGGRVQGYADGGWVYPAPGAVAKYGPGGGTHSYSETPNNWQSDTAWDLMGHDGLAVVAAHDGVVSGTRPFSSEPRFWGRAVYLDVPGGQLYYKHLKDITVGVGQRVTAGTVLGHLGTGVNGGPHLHIGATSLALLNTVVGGAKVAPTTATGAKGSSDGHYTPAADRAPQMTPLQRITKALTAAGIGGKGGAALARSVLTSTSDATTSLSDRNSGASLGAGETRRMKGAGYAAAHRAMNAGKSPQDVADAQKEAERKAEARMLKLHIRRINQTLAKLRKRKQALMKRRDGLRAKAKKAKNDGVLQRAAAEIGKATATITVEMRELVDLRKEANGRLIEIGEEALMEEHQEAYDAAQAAGGDEAGGAATGGDAPSDPGPTEGDWLDAQMAEAQLTEGLGDDLAAAEAIQAAAETAYYQAKAAGDPRQVATAARSLKAARDQVEALRQQIAGAQPANTSTELTAAQKALMDYGTSADSWLRAVMGSGDIGGRFANAWAGGVNVNVQALHPGDASVLAAIGSAVSRAIDTQAYIPSTLSPSGA